MYKGDSDKDYCIPILLDSITSVLLSRCMAYTFNSALILTNFALKKFVSWLCAFAHFSLFITLYTVSISKTKDKSGRERITIHHVVREKAKLK